MQIDAIAHVIQLSIAPVFLLTGVATLLNVLSGRLARVIDRIRVLEERLPGDEKQRLWAEMHAELHVLARRREWIYWGITSSTLSALMICLVIGALFTSAMLGASISGLVAILFILAMLALIISLTLFLREVFLAIHTSRAVLPRDA